MFNKKRLLSGVESSTNIKYVISCDLVAFSVFIRIILLDIVLLL
uniref:Uncharacterized protein n=1 Tax=Siphoviridae sp. ctorp6 TaxID=2825673 RepID=A0A8S5PEA1_9CAUD|nr:MAG TPA: hypothetical protein [Siphoviridae sp. ctorp6]